MAKRVYETYTRKSEKEEWKLSFVNTYHVIAYRREQFAKSRGLLMETRIKDGTPNKSEAAIDAKFADLRAALL